MRVLALDTTTLAGGAALVDDERVLAERSSDADRSQAEQLPAALMGLLDIAGLQLSDVDLFAVAVGPGSFTGLRIGIATMQGLAFVTGRKIVGVSALEALAHVAASGRSAGTIVGAWMDARRQEVFSALYRVGSGPVLGREQVIEIDPPLVDSPHAVMARWGAAFPMPVVIVGDGAQIYADVVGPSCAVEPPRSLAAVIGRIAVHRARLGEGIDPSQIQPLYVRRPDAEIARDAPGTTR